jgi:hypothetical protein
MIEVAAQQLRLHPRQRCARRNWVSSRGSSGLLRSSWIRREPGPRCDAGGATYTYQGYWPIPWRGIQDAGGEGLTEAPAQAPKSHGLTQLRGSGQ